MQRYYRCCFLNGDGEICSYRAFMAVGDKKAVAEAERLFALVEQYAGFELWQGGRLSTARKRNTIRNRVTGDPRFLE